MRRGWALLALVAISGCSGSPVEGSKQHEVEALLRAQLAPVSPKVLAMWYYGGDPSIIICGEIEAPPRLRAQQSTLRFEAMPDAVMLEPHLVAFDATGAQIAAEGVAIFESTWAKGCASNAPPLRRIAAWFGHSPRQGSSDTPLTNAYIDQALARARSR